MTQDAEYAAIDRIKFFGSVASTNGLSEEAKALANKYIVRLMEALGPSVEDTALSLSSLIT